MDEAQLVNLVEAEIAKQLEPLRATVTQTAKETAEMDAAMHEQSKVLIALGDAIKELLEQVAALKVQVADLHDGPGFTVQ